MAKEYPYEERDFRRFMSRAELDRTLNTLCGILEGITLDQKITNDELEELRHWCQFHRQFNDKHPFNELLPIIDSALTDSFLSKEEYEDLMWLAAHYELSSKYFETISASLQVLHGILHGILADNIINDEEIRNLRVWINDHDYLKGSYPYDEIDSLLMSILQDGQITEDERNILKAFFGDFIDSTLSLNIDRLELNELKDKYHVQGICAACPELTLKNSTFCLTGVFSHAIRNNIQVLIEQAGGRHSSGVNKNTDYLVIGAEGNPCWVFACYGRKVEKAIDMRKTGHRIAIIHENDFWDALQEYGIG